MAGRVKAWAAGAAVAAGFAGAASAQSVFSFGDSLSDTGNVESLTFGLEGGGDYFEGRFSNGLNWVDTLSLQISGKVQRTNPGLIGPAWSSFDEGFNFAHGGAVTNYESLDAEDALGFRPPRELLRLADPFVLVGQTRHFRDQKRLFGGRAFRARPEDFATISSGGNDYLNGSRDTAGVTASIVEAMATIRQRGVLNYVVLDLPSLGEIPAEIAGGDRTALNAVAAEHNLALRAGAASFSEAAGARVVVVPLSELFDRIVADATDNNGAQFGFTKIGPAPGTSGHCLGDGLKLDACPDSYLFYDELHPTRAAHDLIGRTAYASLLRRAAAETEPATRAFQAAAASATLNRLVAARLDAGPRAASGRFDAAGPLSFTASRQPAGALAVYRFSNGDTPGRDAATPDTALDRARGGAGFGLSAGEYDLAYGADLKAGPTLRLGAAALATRRSSAAAGAARQAETRLAAVYAAWTAPRAAAALSLETGALETRLDRATGLAEAPAATLAGHVRFAALRASGERRVVDGLAAFGDAAALRIEQAASTERGGLDFLSASLPQAGDRGAALHAGLALSGLAGGMSDWSARWRFSAGALAASDDGLGYGAVLPMDGLIAEPSAGLRPFAGPDMPRRGAGLLHARLDLARNDGARLALEAAALTDADGARAAARLKLGVSF